MKLSLLLGALVLAALLGSGVTAQVPIDRPAPEVTGGPWLNGPPLATAALRGRVVFVEFWTYG
jgi:hypothetical protein